jgi:hypothetical protein
MLFELTVKKNKYTGKIEISNPGYYPTWVYIHPAPKEYYILPASEYEKDASIVTRSEDKEVMFQFLRDTREHMTREGIVEVK